MGEVEYRQIFITSKDAELGTHTISDVYGKYYFVHEVKCTKCPGVGDRCRDCRTCCGQGKVVYMIYHHTTGRKIIALLAQNKVNCLYYTNAFGFDELLLGVGGLCVEHETRRENADDYLGTLAVGPWTKTDKEQEQSKKFGFSTGG